MSFEKELQSESRSALWEKYCGFLSLSMKDYMQIQYRLLREQIDVYKQCPLGKKLLKGTEPITVENFRDVVPFTTYEDYAPYLIPKDESILPGKPTVWLETTWESGCRPSKVAPYTGMLEVYRSNLIAAMMLSTSNGPGDFNVRSGDRVLYTLAPMPYATGLFPLLISSEIKLHFMPSLEEARHLSFSEQNKIGLKQAISGGMDQFFGMSSVIYSITKKFSTLAASGGFHLRDLTGMSPVRLFQLLRSQYLCRRDGRELRPADIFNLRGFVCVGTDSALFKDDLELAWGKRPLEIHGGTDQACIGTETWSKDGLVFYPDTCFYEFLFPKPKCTGALRTPTIPRAYL